MKHSRWLLPLAVAALLPGLASAAAPQTYSPGSDADPRRQAALALSSDQRHLSAALELVGLAGQRHPEDLPEAYQWQLADTLLAFALRDEAQQLYRQLSLYSTDTERYVRSQFSVAELDYQRGRYELAERTLRNVRERVPRRQVDEWNERLSHVLLAQGLYGEATELLEALDTSERQSNYLRYNLAIALINDGRTLQGRDVLDRVGRIPVQSIQDQALRDKANLTLGWHFLQNQQGGTAKAVLQRIRIEGPYSNRGLLGLGWAELSPRGERQARGTDVADEDPFANFSTLGGLLRPGFLERDVYRRAGFRNFRLGDIAKEEEDGLRRALAAWIELINRDPMDPAVQEGWLAIPYTLDRLGAHTQALEYYERAIGELEKSRARMRVAMDSINRNIMVETIVRREAGAEAGRDWRLLDLPDTAETYYLQSLLAEHRFQEALKNYRDLRLLVRNLEAWNNRLGALDRQYRSVVRDAVAPPLLFARALDGRAPPTLEASPRLRSETRLSSPGLYSAAPNHPAIGGAHLRTSSLPVRFNGPLERVANLQGQQVVLLSQARNARDEQAAVLTQMARDELAGQQQVIEKYLVEARFALARLYDRQLRREF